MGKMESPKHDFSEVFCFSKTNMDPENWWFVDVSFSILTFPGVLSIPSRELTYPTWGKGKSSSNMPFFRGMC